jgi:hypothetical protein
MAIVSTLPLVVGQCMEAVKSISVDHEHMAVIVSSSFNVQIDYW